MSGDSGLSSRAMVRPDSTSTRSNDLARVGECHEPAVRRKAEPGTAEFARNAPGGGGPEFAWRNFGGHQPFPVRAETDLCAPIDGKLGHLLFIPYPPDLRTQLMTAGRQPLPVRADGDATAVVQRSDLGQYFPRSGRGHGRD